MKYKDSRGLGFYSQHPHGRSQQSIPPVPGERTPSSGLQGHRHTQIQRHSMWAKHLWTQNEASKQARNTWVQALFVKANEWKRPGRLWMHGKQRHTQGQWENFKRGTTHILLWDTLHHIFLQRAGSIEQYAKQMAISFGLEYKSQAHVYVCFAKAFCVHLGNGRRKL